MTTKKKPAKPVIRGYAAKINASGDNLVQRAALLKLQVTKSFTRKDLLEVQEVVYFNKDLHLIYGPCTEDEVRAFLCGFQFGHERGHEEGRQSLREDIDRAIGGF